MRYKIPFGDISRGVAEWPAETSLNKTLRESSRKDSRRKSREHINQSETQPLSYFERFAIAEKYGDISIEYCTILGSYGDINFNGGY